MRVVGRMLLQASALWVAFSAGEFVSIVKQHMLFAICAAIVSVCMLELADRIGAASARVDHGGRKR